MLYCPFKKGIVKELLYLSPKALFNSNCVIVLFGKVMFAVTLSITLASVTFAAISMSRVRLYILGQRQAERNYQL